ncbi:MAG: AtpZ/AtpI family protein [Acidimicrobiales bacterium]
MRRDEGLERREVYQGFGDGLARAFELALTPAVFGVAGFGIDRWLGTLPVFLLVFVLLAAVGLFVRAWYGYARDMAAHEQQAPWAPPPRRAEAGS